MSAGSGVGDSDASIATGVRGVKRKARATSDENTQPPITGAKMPLHEAPRDEPTFEADWDDGDVEVVVPRNETMNVEGGQGRHGTDEPQERRRGLVKCAQPVDADKQDQDGYESGDSDEPRNKNDERDKDCKPPRAFKRRKKDILKPVKEAAENVAADMGFFFGVACTSGLATACDILT